LTPVRAGARVALVRRLDPYRVDPEEEMAEPGFAPARPAPAVAALLRMQSTAGNEATRRALARATETAPPVKDRVAVFEGVGEYKVVSYSFDGRNEVALTIEVADTSRCCRCPRPASRSRRRPSAAAATR
jgi:hypothetical protein